MAVPSLQPISVSNQVGAANNAIVTGLNLARFTAITSGDAISVCPTSNGTGCTDSSWDHGWFVFNDADADTLVDGDEVIRVRDQESNVTQSGYGSTIVFLADGTSTLGSGVTITSCHAHGSSADPCLDLSISVFGHITSAKHATVDPEEGGS